MFLKKSEEVKSLSESDYIIIRFRSIVNEKFNLWHLQNPDSSKRVFRQQFEAEMISQLSLFKSLDPELEAYITSGKFLDFEKKHYCRNYFVLSPVPLNCDICDFDSIDCNRCCSLLLKSGRHKVLGYFSLAGKTIHLTDSDSKKILSRMAYFSPNKLDYVESYLIGHLSKNYFNNYDSEISGDDLFLRIFQLIRQFHSFLGINIIRVDCCSGNAGVLKFYEQHGFRVLDHLSPSIPSSVPFTNLSDSSAPVLGPCSNGLVSAELGGLVMLVRKVS